MCPCKETAVERISQKPGCFRCVSGTSRPFNDARVHAGQGITLSECKMSCHEIARTTDLIPRILRFEGGRRCAAVLVRGELTGLHHGFRSSEHGEEAPNLPSPARTQVCTHVRTLRATQAVAPSRRLDLAGCDVAMASLSLYHKVIL